MIREGYVKETYTQALIRREEKFPTGLIQDVKILEKLLSAADQKEVIQIIRPKEELP